MSPELCLSSVRNRPAACRDNFFSPILGQALHIARMVCGGGDWQERAQRTMLSRTDGRSNGRSVIGLLPMRALLLLPSLSVTGSPFSPFALERREEERRREGSSPLRCCHCRCCCCYCRGRRLPGIVALNRVIVVRSYVSLVLISYEIAFTPLVSKGSFASQSPIDYLCCYFFRSKIACHCCLPHTS